MGCSEAWEPCTTGARLRLPTPGCGKQEAESAVLDDPNLIPRLLREDLQHKNMIFGLTLCFSSFGSLRVSIEVEDSRVQLGSSGSEQKVVLIFVYAMTCKIIPHLTVTLKFRGT